LINRITQACLGAGAYTISVGTMNPAIVLPRLLDALAVLSPSAHRELVAPGGAFASIPAEMLCDAANPWWTTATALAVVDRILGALNAAAPAGFCCVYSEGDRFELVRIEDPTARHAPAPTPSFTRRSSAIRCRVLTPEP
jgi:hypothetical protein